MGKQPPAPVEDYQKEFQPVGPDQPSSDPGGASETPAAPLETELGATETVSSDRTEVQQRGTSERSKVPPLVRGEDGRLRYLTLPSHVFPDIRWPCIEPQLGDESYRPVDRLISSSVKAQGSVSEAYKINEKLSPSPTGRRRHKVPVNSHDPADLGRELELFVRSTNQCFRLENFKAVGFDPKVREAGGFKPFEWYMDFYSEDTRVRAVLIRNLAKMYLSLSVPRFDPTAPWTL